MSKEMENYLFYAHRFMGNWREFQIDTLFYSAWVFLKSLVLAVFIDLAYDARFLMGSVIQGLGNLADGTSNEITLFAEKAQETVEMFSTSTVFGSIGGVELIAPDFAINWPFWLIAFAAGRTSSRVGSTAGYIVGLIFLYVALIPEFSQELSTREFITQTFGKLALAGFGAIYSGYIPRKKKERALTTSRGMFKFSMNVPDQSTFKELCVVVNTLESSKFCERINVDPDEYPPEGQNFCAVKGSVIGPKLLLPGARMTLEKMLPKLKITSTEVSSLG